MKENTKTNKKVVKIDKKQDVTESAALIQQLNRDVRDSVLIVSLLINAYVLIGWLVIQISNSYDVALINYLQSK